MKCTLTILFLMACFFSIAQQSKQGFATTNEEYNYLTTGYKIQIESGLDMKKGYSFNNMLERELGAYTFNIKSLIRDSSHQVAALLVIVHSSVSGKDYYVCLPHHNQELTNKYWAVMNTWDRPILIAYSQVIGLLFGTDFAVMYQLNDKINTKTNKH